MSEDDQPTYKFKWTNIDLEDFVKQRKFVATKLRRDAEILVRRAEQIEEEATSWEIALEVVTDD